MALEVVLEVLTPLPRRWHRTSATSKGWTRYVARARDVRGVFDAFADI